MPLATVHDVITELRKQKEVTDSEIDHVRQALLDGSLWRLPYAQPLVIAADYRTHVSVTLWLRDWRLDRRTVDWIKRHGGQILDLPSDPPRLRKPGPTLTVFQRVEHWRAPYLARQLYGLALRSRT